MSTKPGTIVVGVDASEQSMRALVLGGGAERGRAPHADAGARGPRRVSRVPGRCRRLPAGRRDPPARRGPAGARRRPAEVARIAPDVEVDQVLRIADPRAVLLELSHDAAMVVLGSRGRGQLRSLLLGSVGTALVRHAHCPVVVHRPGNPGLVRNGILVGVDASPESTDRPRVRLPRGVLARPPADAPALRLGPAGRRPGRLPRRRVHRRPGDASAWRWPRRSPGWLRSTPTSGPPPRSCADSPRRRWCVPASG